MPVMPKRIICLSLAVGAVGPVLLIPVAVWLDSYSHTLATAMQWEPLFRWLWPTSPMLMGGSANRILGLSYFALLFFTALANVVLFGLFGVAVAGLAILVRTLSRLRKPGPRNS